MRTAQERVEALHQRAEELAGRRRENAALVRLGTACGLLLACLTALVFGTEHAHTGVSPGAYTGAAMLFESAGGYVLVAVIAFAVGAILTTAILRHRKTQGKQTVKSESNDQGGHIE